MKSVKMILALLLLPLLLSGCVKDNDSEKSSGTGEYPSPSMVQPFEPEYPENSGGRPKGEEDELRALWIYYMELDFRDTDEQGFKSRVDMMFDDAASMKLNVVIVQIRPFCDAFYDSQIFPYSEYLTGTQGEDPGYDPLAYMVEAAHARGLKFHAWLNPFRVSMTSEDPEELAENNPGRIYLSDGDGENDDWAVVAAGGIYLNPAVPEVRELITEGVREIIDNYPVDGIHFDDYFYPTTDSEFDAAAYERYLAEAGEEPMTQEDFRRENMNIFVKGVYDSVKEKNSEILFGISPMADIENNYDHLYADIPLWMEEPGYVDYILPQTYFGFEHMQEAFQFDTLASRWHELERHESVELYYGLPVYKIGDLDQGSEEWLLADDIIRRQVEYTRELSGCGGFALYSYGPLFSGEELNTAQREKLLEILE